VRKRSGSNKYFFWAKAKRQQQIFFLRESEAAAQNEYPGTETTPSPRFAKSRILFNMTISLIFSREK